ncbi:tyrosine-protein kinase family protein [Actibacterium lipolyticum]|uniref:Tyrosine-protein kinase etk n=1 Tax=Actibacterium lipolyticum TaxID=1524263 RepID=A0A238KUF6_9RHOB|nr:CpsD/CapB family tyrosine-protein kinase [Actibacterium lipolyticum]SMX46463.1 Tyrosine-protein kinase etk [Actibacterium lipolyticum]
MERLQAAIKQAREMREGTAGRRVRAAQGGFQSASLPTQDAWAALSPLEVKPPKGKRARLVSLEGGADAMPYDMLRTKVLQVLHENNWRRIAITSPTAGCGKTTTAANLAISLGRQVDMRTILMDMDMRRPSLKNVFDQTGAHSVPDILEGRVDFAQQARRLGDNVAVSFNFKHYGDPAGLFLRHTTETIIDQIEATYRPGVMLFDMPPLMANDDTAAFLRNVDCAMIVAEAENTTAAQIDMCERELAAQTNVLGVVLNKCRFPDENYGYAYQ